MWCGVDQCGTVARETGKMEAENGNGNGNEDGNVGGFPETRVEERRDGDTALERWEVPVGGGRLEGVERGMEHRRWWKPEGSLTRSP